MARGFMHLIAGVGMAAVLAGGVVGLTPETASAAGRADCERGDRNAIDGLPEPEIVGRWCRVEGRDDRRRDDRDRRDDRRQDDREGRDGPYSVHFDSLTRHERSTDPRGELERGHDMRVTNVTVECREFRYDRDGRTVFRGCGRAR
ncbi:hypothetical protein [Streptomyces sp. UNOC14_S4]|uniref:hypothetical protein n=1 Tax=Streptomyces sp. UNOC14_S4 TaxID=2872340 RepID=UPI001E5A3B34|nr:hypothetical protein [Streptomyces sp. UNOC14_S4]MCC3770625.1 hypothetical protein [Streptomyces sp. UNOC14_S4]